MRAARRGVPAPLDPEITCRSIAANATPRGDRYTQGDMYHTSTSAGAVTITAAGRSEGVPSPDVPSYPRPMVRGLVATALTATLLGYAALTPIAPFARNAYENDVRRHIVFGGAIAAYAIFLLATRRRPWPTILDWPLAAVLLAMAAAVTRSLDPRVSAEWVIIVLPVLPLFYLFADPRLIDAAAIRRAALISGGVVAAFALASVWRQWAGWVALARAVDGELGLRNFIPPAVPRVEGVGSHPNVAAGVLAVIAPLYLVAVRRAPADATAAGDQGGARWVARASRSAAAAGFALALVALFFTLSRAAWAGAAAGIAVTSLGLTFAHARAPRWWRRWVIGGLAAGLLLVAGVTVLGRARPDWLFRDSLNPRADMRRVGLEIVREHPVTGAGPGMYVSLYARHDGVHPFAAVHSHNTTVQIAADHGLAGLGAAALLLTTVVAMLARRYTRGDWRARHQTAATAGGLVAFLVHGLADSPHLFPEILLLLAALTALAIRESGEPSARAVELDAAATTRPTSMPPPAGSSTRAPGRRRASVSLSRLVSRARPLPVGAVLVAGLLLLPVWALIDRAAAAHDRGVRLAATERWDGAVSAAERSSSRDPRFAAYHLQLGAARAARYRAAGNPADRDAAILAYSRGLALNDANAAAYADLAALMLDAGDRSGARRAMEALRSLAGRDQLLLLAYAVLVQRAGDPAEAVDTYAGLLALQPALALTSFWMDDDFRRGAYDAIVDRSLARAEEITGPGNAEGLRDAIRLLTGRGTPDEARLRASLAAMPADATLAVALGRLLIAERRSEAGTLLRDAVARRGDSPDARSALGDWYAAEGDVTRARREWLRASYLGDVAAGDALGRSFTPRRPPPAVIAWQRRLVDGVWFSRFYLPLQAFRFTFLRHEPVPIIGPGDWLDALPRDLDVWQANLDRWQQQPAGVSDR